MKFAKIQKKNKELNWVVMLPLKHELEFGTKQEALDFMYAYNQGIYDFKTYMDEEEKKFLEGFAYRKK